ncbi:alpha/beta hydrolase [Brevibacterium casei]|nr:alpha/beta hydrolase [Brevibacterium casei]
MERAPGLPRRRRPRRGRQVPGEAERGERCRLSRSSRGGRAPSSTASPSTSARRPPRRGGKDPVLFLNGCALAAAGWLPVIAEMPDRDVIALDRPGFAGTRWPGTLPDLAGELAAMERAIAGHSRVVIVAHSMAAFRAEAFARLRPERVAGIVLVDPSIEDYRSGARPPLLARHMDAGPRGARHP